jgi:hypothetical protein
MDPKLAENHISSACELLTPYLLVIFRDRKKGAKRKQTWLTSQIATQ